MLNKALHKVKYFPCLAKSGVRPAKSSTYVGTVPIFTIASMPRLRPTVWSYMISPIAKFALVAEIPAGFGLGSPSTATLPSLPRMLPSRKSISCFSFLKEGPSKFFTNKMVINFPKESTLEKSIWPIGLDSTGSTSLLDSFLCPFTPMPIFPFQKDGFRL